MPHVANRTSLTNKIIKATRWDGRAHHVLWDDRVPGLGLRVRATSKTFVVRLREDGRNRRVTLGRWSERESRSGLTLVEARGLAKERLAGLPVEAEAVVPEKAATLRGVWDAFQRTEFPRLAERTQQDYRDRWKNHLEPALGAKRVDEIKGGDAIDLHASMSKTPTSANRTGALLSNLWNYAKARGDLGIPEGRENPARAVDKRRRYREAARRRRASADELRALFEAVDGCEADGTISPAEAVGLLLVPYALLRPVEITRLRWAWVDLDAGLVQIPPNQAKGARIARSDEPEVAVLSGPIVERLRELERDGERVIESARGGARYDLAGPWNLVKARAGVGEDLIWYDLKRTSLSILRDDGVPDAWRHAAARHREQGVQERHYAQANVEQARKAVGRLAELLEEAKR